MTAEEMFKELGYDDPTREVHDFIEEEYLEYTNGEITIDLNLTYKIVMLFDGNSDIHLDVPTLKALYKQCEELGWLE